MNDIISGTPIIELMSSTRSSSINAPTRSDAGFADVFTVNVSSFKRAGGDFDAAVEVNIWRVAILFAIVAVELSSRREDDMVLGLA
jgi:hypothetical protein